MIRGMAPTRSNKTADVKRRPTLGGSERSRSAFRQASGRPCSLWRAR
jgi:hypothetical protein